MEFKEIIEKAIQIRNKYKELEKVKYGREWTGEEMGLGLVGDVGDLMKLIQSKEGIRENEDVDSKLAHELSDCLWSILILADKYNVDIEKSFLGTMNELDNKLSK
jgi:NTP pyrophosphatase (non-canonical NTP hydrolase)